MMFVRYPYNHESDSVRMWNLDSNQVLVTCDVIWLKHMFFEHKLVTDVTELETDGTTDNA